MQILRTIGEKGICCCKTDVSTVQIYLHIIQYHKTIATSHQNNKHICPRSKLPKQCPKNTLVLNTGPQQRFGAPLCKGSRLAGRQVGRMADRSAGWPLGRLGGRPLKHSAPCKNCRGSRMLRDTLLDCFGIYYLSLVV